MTLLATKTTLGGVLGDTIIDASGTYEIERVIADGVYVWGLASLSVSVTPLHKYSAAMTVAATTASSDTLPLSAAQINSKFDPHGMGVGNTVVIQQAGLYRVDFSTLLQANGSVFLRVNGVAVSTMFAGPTSTSALQWAGNLALGDVITLFSGFSATWTSPSLVVQQLPVATVVDPGLVPVNDQAASRYFDIGTMRIQWGSVVVPTNGTITFPAPFANTVYSVQLTIGSAYNGVPSPLVKSVGSMTIDNRLSVNGVPISGAGPLEWFAIGLKP